MPRVKTVPRPPLTRFERQALEFARLRYGRYVPPPHLARPAPWQPGQPWTSLAPPPRAVPTADQAPRAPLPGPALLPVELMLERRLAGTSTPPPIPAAPPPATVTPVPEVAQEPEAIKMRGLLGW